MASHWNDQVSEGAVLLCVNQRLSRHYVAKYQSWQLAKGNIWWETPAILPFRSWVRAMHRQALGMGLTDLTLMPALLVQRAWRNIIDSDTSVQLLDAAGASRSALQAWDASCAWHCRNNEEHYLSADQFAWQRWVMRYMAWLDVEKGVDEALLPDELASILSRASVEQRAILLPKVLILEGYLQLPTQVDALVKVIEQCGTHVMIQEADSAAVVHAVSYADDNAEMLGIATQMRAELERDPAQSLGLVVPDLQQRRDEVVRAFERVFYPMMSPLQIRAKVPAYEVSLGQSLASQPVVAAGLLLLRLVASSISGSELSATLLCPYWKAADVEMRRREQLDNRLRDRRVRALTLEQFSEELDRGSRLTPLVNKLVKRRKLKAAALTEWAARFSDWLKLLDWPGSSIDSEEYQAVSSWMDCLDDMQVLDDGKTLRFNDAFAQLKSLAEDRIFQLETPAAPIQVMGRLESHGLAFDCLWVAGLDAEQWPPKGSPSAFLNISQQKACNVPDSSAALRLALAEKEFALWASQAPLLITSGVQLRDGKALSPASVPNIEPSRQNIDIAQTRLGALQQNAHPVDPLQTIAQTLELETVDDFMGPSLDAGARVGGGARLFENQALCPFRAFALHRLKIRPLEEVGIGLDARQHGTLLHGALELFWDNVKSHEALMQLSPQQLDEILQDVVQQSMKAQEVPAELNALELVRVTSLMREWLEQCEMPRQPFTVKKLEHQLELEHGGVIMNVIIDRIDEVNDTLIVIDYKTGVNNRVSTWADQRISNPQLPLYVLSDEEIAAASFAQVATNQCRFVGIASDDQTLPKVSTGQKVSVHRENSEPLTQWPQWRAHWQESLDEIASEVRQGVATVTPMKAACTYCELKPLCRIDSTQILELSDADDASADAQAGSARGAMAQ